MRRNTHSASLPGPSVVQKRKSVNDHWGQERTHDQFAIFKYKPNIVLNCYLRDTFVRHSGSNLN